VVGVDNVMGPILWTHYFPEEQGCKVIDNVLSQDNQSATHLETNGRASARRRLHHVNIRCFFVTNQVVKGLLSMRHCPTDNLDSDCHAKLLQGKKFVKFCCRIMGFDENGT